MLYLSNIRTQEGNKARTASSSSPNDFKTMAGPSQKVCSLLLTSYESQNVTGRVFNEMSHSFKKNTELNKSK